MRVTLNRALALRALAAVIWALGDPDSDAAVDRLDTIYRSYRSRRLAAAARALEPH